MLKSCRRCGGMATTYVNEEHDKYMVGCDCGAQTRTFGTPVEATAAWNRLQAYRFVENPETRYLYPRRVDIQPTNPWEHVDYANLPPAPPPPPPPPPQPILIPEIACKFINCRCDVECTLSKFCGRSYHTKIGGI